MEQEIKLFKLLTSEEIVTRVVEENDEYFILEKPRLCAMQQGKDAEGNVGNYLVLLPWIMYATDPNTKTEKDIKLYKRVIAGESVEVPIVMEKEYLSTISPIQIV